MAVTVTLPDGLAVFDGDGLRLRHQITDGSPQRPVAASISGRLLAARKTVGGADAVGVWDMDTGGALATVAGVRVEFLALAADDRTLVTVGEGVLRVWDLATGRERGRRPLPAAATWAAADAGRPAGGDRAGRWHGPGVGPDRVPGRASGPGRRRSGRGQVVRRPGE